MIEINKITDFKILGKLGEGSFSNVFKGLIILSVRRITDDQIYAMKRIQMNQISYKDKENALNEIRYLASIKSPYIIEYKDSFYDDVHECLCIIMEYAIYGDLNSYIEKS